MPRVIGGAIQRIDYPQGRGARRRFQPFFGQNGRLGIVRADHIDDGLLSGRVSVRIEIAPAFGMYLARPSKAVTQDSTPCAGDVAGKFKTIGHAQHSLIQ